MDDNQRQNKLRYITSREEFEQRCQRRIREELGVNPAGAEVILHLRRQVLDLQSQLRLLQAELQASQGRRQEQVMVYRREYIEATWVDEERQTPK
jgi:hypothetical protein